MKYNSNYIKAMQWIHWFSLVIVKCAEEIGIE